jgi:O-antigen/teichoic acid export membrane protein
VTENDGIGSANRLGRLSPLGRKTDEKSAIEMTAIGKSVGAGYIARGWSALLSLIAVPLYIRFLGVEAYGVVGAFVTLQAFLSLLDFGLGTAVAREISREKDSYQDVRDLIRTVETVFWLIAVLAGAVIWTVAPWIAQHWLRPAALSRNTVAEAIALAGVSFACQWPGTLYTNGLFGFHRQVSAARALIVTGTFRVSLTIVSLWLLAPSLKVFFICQAVGNLAQSLTTRWLLWHVTPGEGHPCFRVRILRRISGFASGIAGITATSIALTQLDKAILSKTLGLAAFGYYIAATTLASGLYVVVSPVFSVLLPRFSRLVEIGDTGQLVRLYHGASQFLAAAVMPIAITGLFFSKQILFLWTHNRAVAANAYPVFSLLVAGNAINGLLNVPYAVQLAYGWTSLSLWTNVVAIAVFAPMIYFFSVNLGGFGGALAWLLISLAITVCSIAIMHSKRLKGHQWQWYSKDVGMPALAVLIIVWVVHRTIWYFTSNAWIIVPACLAMAVIGAAAASPIIRARTIRMLRINRMLVS